MGLSIDRSAISRIENQERTLSDLEFLYFAAALRINPVRLFSLAYKDPAKLPAYPDYEAEEELLVAEEESGSDALP
jgi:transcriptional regulator with XRE-family HTH domain